MEMLIKYILDSALALPSMRVATKNGFLMSSNSKSVSKMNVKRVKLKIMEEMELVI